VSPESRRILPTGSTTRTAPAGWAGLHGLVISRRGRLALERY
jgi:hypothetical protein